MNLKAKLWAIYVAIAIGVWIFYCHSGESQYKSTAYNLGGALVWPISIWRHT